MEEGRTLLRESLGHRVPPATMGMAQTAMEKQGAAARSW